MSQPEAVYECQAKQDGTGTIAIVQFSNGDNLLCEILYSDKDRICLRPYDERLKFDTYLTYFPSRAVFSVVRPKLSQSDEAFARDAIERNESEKRRRELSAPLNAPGSIPPGVIKPS